MIYVLAFLLAFAISAVVTPLTRRLALARDWVDRPAHARKVHTQPIPRIGGLAIALAFTGTLLLYFNLNKPFYGLLAGLLILLGVGIIDDIKGLGAWTKLAWQVVAAVAVLAGGIGIVTVSNPLGGLIALDGWRIPVELGWLQFNILPIANLVSVLWIVGMINVVNFLDGLDGLATGVSSIACLALFVMALSPVSGNPTVAMTSIILLGSLLGFLPYNFYPARIFMGDSGSYVTGMLLALLSIYSGSKIAIGSMVLGFAIADAVWVVIRRLLRKQSPFQPDRLHLHHMLFDSGLFTHRQIVLLLYVLAIIVAAVVLLANSVLAFGVLISLMAGLTILVKLLKPGKPA